MKKLHLLSVTLVAVCVFSALVAASASATVTFLLAEWLVNGTALTGELNVATSGELSLEDTKGGLFGEAVDVLCSVILTGTIGLNGTDLITKLLNLDKQEISGTALTGLALLGCTTDAACGNETDIEVWAVHMPWLTAAELMMDGTETFFVDLIVEDGAGLPGWFVLCLLSGFGAENECLVENEGIIKLTNEAPNVDALFEEAFTVLAGIKLAKCDAGGETGVVAGLATMAVIPTGSTLTVSSE